MAAASVSEPGTLNFRFSPFSRPNQPPLPSLSAFDDQPDRWLDVRWDIDEAKKSRFPARILLSVINEPGALAEVARIIGDSDGNIDNIVMTSKSQDFREMTIDLEVWDLKHLSAVISDLRAKTIVSAVHRFNG
jgi:GTP diphosphokinase / guanosine-3',5'-bis(diphosphate) 3'-diphosphatase